MSLSGQPISIIGYCQARSDLLTQKCPGELDENCVQIEPVHRILLDLASSE